MTTTYTGECRRCGHEQKREWKGEPWEGYDGEASFAADCHRCGPGVELTMFPEEPETEDGFRHLTSDEMKARSENDRLELLARLRRVRLMVLNPARIDDEIAHIEGKRP